MQSLSSENAPRPPSDGRAAAIDRILAVAGEEAVRVGPERIRMGEIAARAHVSRASLYRYFASKDELIRAWTTRELETIIAKADQAASQAESFDDRLAIGFASALVSLREHPVFRAVVASNNTQIVRSTLESGEAIDHARELIVARFNVAVHSGRLSVGQFDAEISGELIARLAVSLTVAPETIGRLDSEEDVRAFAKQYIAPLVHGAAEAVAN